MPWILIPIIFVLSLDFRIGEESINAYHIILPLAVALGLRYGERGMMTLIIGAIPLLFHFGIPYEKIKIVAGNKFDFYFLSVFLCGLAMQHPQLFRIQIKKYTSNLLVGSL